MKKTVRTIAIYIFAAVLAVFCLFTTAASSYISARADTALEYDISDPLDDLENSTIAGEDFRLEDYPYVENGDPQVIAFVVYCYAYYDSDRENYGLYVYVYNPGGFEFDSTKNALHLKTGNNLSHEYQLRILSFSRREGAEGLFYKLKVNFTAEERASLFANLDRDSRVYEIAGIELSRDGIITEYEVGSTYTYTGYAAGYGAFEGAESTLDCVVDNFNLFLSLDVRTTYYRAKGTNGEAYSHDTLHSVYFSVPNDIIEEYGDMSAVHATWLNAKTTPIFVTGNSQVYTAVSKYLGQTVDGGNFTYADDDTSPLSYALIGSKYIESAGDNNASYGVSYMSYNANREYTASDIDLYNLAYCFYAEGGDADSYILPGEMLVGNREENIEGWFKTYTEAYGSNKEVDGRFSSELFEEVDEAYTDINITSGDTFELTDEITSQNLWQQLYGGGYNVDSTNIYTISAIKRVLNSDFKQTAAATCENLYIDETDYEEFKEFYDEAQSNNETVYLFRYYQSSYTSYEVATYTRGKGTWTLLGTQFGYKFVDTNAYFAQMWVQLGFEIIDLTFTKSGISTVIPVVMSPIDIAADADPPFMTTDDVDWLAIALLGGISLAGLVITCIVKYYYNKNQSGNFGRKAR